MVLEADNFVYANEAKITYLKLAYRDVWQNATSILNKDKYVINPLYNGLEVILCV